MWSTSQVLLHLMELNFPFSRLLKLLSFKVKQRSIGSDNFSEVIILQNMIFDYLMQICFHCIPNTIYSVTNKKFNCPAASATVRKLDRYSHLKLLNNSCCIVTLLSQAGLRIFLHWHCILFPDAPTSIIFIIFFFSCHSAAKYYYWYPTKVQILNTIPNIL